MSAGVKSSRPENELNMPMDASLGGKGAKVAMGGEWQVMQESPCGD